MKRLMILALATTLSAAALAQTWKDTYQAGLYAAQDGKWATAREDFKVAAKLRPGDISKPTLEVTGAPYSPGFLAAYCGLKEGFLLSGNLRSHLLKQVAHEFEGLISQGQYSTEAFFFLDQTYMLLGETTKRVKLADEVTDLGPAMAWKIDTSGIQPDDEALIADLPKPTTTAQPVRGPEVKPVSLSTTPMKPQAPAQTPVHHGPKYIPEVSNTTVQGKAAGPTAPATLPASTESNQTPVPSPVEPTTPVPAKATVSGSTQAKVTSPADTSVKMPVVTEPMATPAAPATGTTTAPAPTIFTTQPTPAPANTTPIIAPAPAETTTKPSRRHHGKKDKDQPDTTTAPADTTTVEPVTIKTIEHPPVIKAKANALTVPTMPTKYAIIIGNGQSKMDGGAMPFAGDDAQFLRQALVENAGYANENIELVIDATSAQIAATVNALASRVGDKGTILFYFSGVGANIDGKDYLAGVDSDVTNDTSTMIAKDDVYKAFMVKGARIYAFYQCNRPITDGHFFGSEIPLVGSISQMQATLPGQTVNSVNTGGKVVGLFTNGFVNTLKDIRSNQTPILDFGWQLFYNLRRGDTGTEGGSSNQSPSLPVLTNMASDARF